MSFTYRLFTTQPLLPGIYGLDITATSNNGYGSLLRSFAITETGAPPPVETGDTLRTLNELLTLIWADGQGLNQLNAKDCRETVISLALKTGDFSRLPRSATGLAAGRVFVDGEVLRVNLLGITYTATPEFLNSAGSLTANARHAIQHATAKFFGGGGLIAHPV